MSSGSLSTGHISAFRDTVGYTGPRSACDDVAMAKLWLDAKRAYLELRPHLRRLYTRVPDVERAR
jgi:hypothetical protein